MGDFYWGVRRSVSFVMLRVNNLTKTFTLADGRVEAVSGVSFEVPEGVFLTLLGPSGCGKTTTLRCVAGLEVPEAGEIYIGENLVFSSEKRVMLPAYRRGVGMVFQSYAIWPHMTVFENVAFPILRGGYKVGKAEVGDRVRKALHLVGLEQFESRPAPLLSGGQQQRVSLARALVYEPRLLLLDEPLSNLDAKLREEMRIELRELINRLKISTLYVTHDQEEALVLSDRIAVMYDGQILQESPPREIYLFPTHPFVAGFVGRANFIEGRVAQQGAELGTGVAATPLGDMVIPLPAHVSVGDRVSIVIRPEDMSVDVDGTPSGPNSFPGRVEYRIFVGNRVQYRIRIGSSVLHSELPARIDLQEDTKVSVRIPTSCIRVLRPQ